MSVQLDRISSGLAATGGVLIAARALGVYGAMGGLGSVVGLLVGGALTEYLDWRWILFVNIPIGLVALAGTGAFGSDGERRSGVDLPGSVPSSWLSTKPTRKAGQHRSSSCRRRPLSSC